MNWTATEIKRRPSTDQPTLDVTIEFKSDYGHVMCMAMRFADASSIATTWIDRTTKAINHFEFDLNPLNMIERDIAGASEILSSLVRYIRANSNCTISQVILKYDEVFPDAPWKASGFIQIVRNYLKTHGEKRIQTWEEFKTYVIERKVVNVDG